MLKFKVDAKTAQKATEGQVKIMLVTPELAQEWLSKNENNRPINWPSVRAYSKAMKEGQWGLTHLGIAFDVNGNLQDGQHRLLAVIESETSQEFMVSTGMPLENFTKIDNHNVRKIKQILTLEGIPNVTPFSEIARFMITTSEVSVAATASSSRLITNEQFMSFVNANKEILEQLTNLALGWADEIGGVKVLEPRFSGGLYWEFSKFDQAKAFEFFEKLAKGNSLELGNPILTLRKALSKEPLAKKKMRKIDKLGAIILAFNAFRKGETDIKLTWNKKKMKFPVIEKEILEAA